MNETANSEGQVAVVTRARRRIGETIALELAAERATVCRLVSAATPVVLSVLSRISYMIESSDLQCDDTKRKQLPTTYPRGSLRHEVTDLECACLSIYPGRTATPRQATAHELAEKPYRPERLIQPEDTSPPRFSVLSGTPWTADVTNISMRPFRPRRRQSH